MKTVLASGPRRLLTTGDMLSRQPPARHFGWRRRIADVVYNEDVADVARHFSGDVSVVRIHIEPMHADAARFLERDQLRMSTVSDVVNTEAALIVRIALSRFNRRDVRRLHAEFLRELGVIGLAPERRTQLRA